MIEEYPTLTRSSADKMLMDAVNKSKGQTTIQPETIEETEENIGSDFLTDEEAFAGKTQAEKSREAARQKAIAAGQKTFIDPTTGEIVNI